MKRIVFISGILALVVAAGVSYEVRSQLGGIKTGAPVFPRFASLRSGEANMRTGPGTRYPIEWVYKHQGLPVEILAKDDDDIWRRVRDPEGAEGWMHKTELSGKREAIVNGSAHNLFEDKDRTTIVAHLESGAVGQVLSCAKDWCKVKFESVKGYLPKTDFWGAYPDEIFD
jgi:SH3-like domain-containing protein